MVARLFVAVLLALQLNSGVAKCVGDDPPPAACNGNDYFKVSVYYRGESANLFVNYPGPYCQYSDATELMTFVETHGMFITTQPTYIHIPAAAIYEVNIVKIIQN